MPSRMTASMLIPQVLFVSFPALCAMDQLEGVCTSAKCRSSRSEQKFTKMGKCRYTVTKATPLNSPSVVPTLHGAGGERQSSGI